MKSTITIEREYFDNEEGVPCVKRIVKEDGVLLYEDSLEVSLVEKLDMKINIFERWINRIKNPNKRRVVKENKNFPGADMILIN